MPSGGFRADVGQLAVRSSVSSHRKPVLRLPAGKRAVIAAAAVLAVGAAGAIAVGSALAGTGSAPAMSPPGPVTAVGDVYQVPVAAQAAARAFWTPSRMAFTVTPPVPQSAVTSKPGPRFAPAVSARSVRKAARSGKGAPAGTPNSWSFGGVPTVGALFYTTGSGKHFCTASVIHTAVGSIVLTAAHCVYTNSFARNLEFVPAYDNGRQPYGVWAVTQITVAWAWKQHQDPNLDVAFLNVAAPPDAAGTVEQNTGALNIAFALPDAQKHVTVIGYNDTDQQPIRCTTSTFRFRHLQMEFYCSGFWYGTSGGPWILRYNSGNGTGTVFGVIGGYEWGGYQSWASYSAAFERPAQQLLKQAVTAAQSSRSA